MTLDRSKAPQAQEISHIDLIKPEIQILENQIPMYIFNAGEQELIRVEWVFNNGNWDVNHPLSASAAHQLLTGGTLKKSAKEIIEAVDYYGAFLQTDYSFDKLTFTLFTLNKYFTKVLPIVKDCLTHSIFPQKEIKIFADTQKQNLAVALQKNDFVARKKFAGLLFGDSLYGYETLEKDYDNLEHTQLLSFFEKIYQPQNCEIFVAGKVNQEITSALHQTFGNWHGTSSLINNSFECSKTIGEEIYIEKPNALQSAIRLGQTAINRDHEDFIGMQFVNCLLGGYFGSRLMANIREDKGYTYGIGSALVSLKHAGYLFIATEVGAEVCSATLKEIEYEIDVLQNKAAEEDEINLVRNYLLGSYLGSLENAFSHADKFKNVHAYGLDYSYYDKYLYTIKHIQANEITTLAKKYLNFNAFNKVIVGKK